MCWSRGRNASTIACCSQLPDGHTALSSSSSRCASAGTSERREERSRSTSTRRLQRSTHSATSPGSGNPSRAAWASTLSSPPARPATALSITSGSIVGSAVMRRTEGFPTEGS